MREEIKLEPSENLAYWVGLVQSDGSFGRYFYTTKLGKKKEFVTVRLVVKDLDLAERFKAITKSLFKRGSGPFLMRRDGTWKVYLGVKTLLSVFSSLDIKFGDPPVPPKWATKPEFFGAYLAGVIDGDGDIRIKRPKYPQCMIRISSGAEQLELKSVIQTLLKCGAYITKRHRRVYFKKLGYFIDGKWCELCFLVSSKTEEFIRKFLLPHLVLDRKRDKLSEYLKKFEN